MASNQAAQIQYEMNHKSDTQVPKIIGALTVSLCIFYLVVFLRILSRRLSRSPFKMDDWIIISSLVL